jgi:hypothetical protein
MNPGHHGIGGNQIELARGRFVYRAVIAYPDHKISGASRRLTDTGDNPSFSSWLRHAPPHFSIKPLAMKYKYP